MMKHIFLIGILIFNFSFSVIEGSKLVEKYVSVVKGFELIEEHFDDNTTVLKLKPQLFPEIASAEGKFNNNKVGTLKWLRVNKELRNNGFGTTMFKLMCSRLFAYGCSTVEWKAFPFEGELNDDGTKLVAFYEKRGATVTGSEKYHPEMPPCHLMHITKSEFEKKYIEK